MKPTTKPDTDNIAKICLDALNGIAYHDDAQIVELQVSKLYSDEPRVVVWLAVIEA
jgi:Holliday junction resolvase RusA-like endonuclease